MSDEWKSWYGEVVWVKSGKLPWWPCYVYDPGKLPTACGELVKTISLREVGKKYLLYFYADSNYQWIEKSAMTPFNDETKEMFKGQTVSKRYLADFKQAVQIADEEIQKDKEDRVSWHSMELPAPTAAEPVQREMGRPKSPKSPKSPKKNKAVKLKRGRSNELPRGLPPTNHIAYASEKEKEKEDMRLCVLCKDREALVVLLPCRHLCLCDTCSTQLAVCPLCREEIEHKVSVLAYA
jgi:hypothetical protein